MSQLLLATANPPDRGVPFLYLPCKHIMTKYFVSCEIAPRSRCGKGFWKNTIPTHCLTLPVQAPDHAFSTPILESVHINFFPLRLSVTQSRVGAGTDSSLPRRLDADNLVYEHTALHIARLHDITAARLNRRGGTRGSKVTRIRI